MPVSFFYLSSIIHNHRIVPLPDDLMVLLSSWREAYVDNMFNWSGIFPYWQLYGLFGKKETDIF